MFESKDNSNNEKEAFAFGKEKRNNDKFDIAIQKNSYYLEINDNVYSENNNDTVSTSGCESLDPAYYSISSLSVKPIIIDNDSIDIKECESGYTTPEKICTPPLPRRYLPIVN